MRTNVRQGCVQVVIYMLLPLWGTMASTVWKGYLTFGLISVPIRLFAAARTERVGFHQIHSVCNTRIRQQLYCPTCERTVERSEIVKGYEIDKNRWVTIEDDEVKKIAPPSTDTMEIIEFVKIADIDPLYYDASYYAVPEDPGRKAYQLLVETMEKTGYAAIAKVGMHQREYIVVARPRDNGITLHTLYFPNEVRAVPEYSKHRDVEIKPQEIQLAEQLVKSLAGPFEPQRFEDEYQKRVIELIEAKGEGHAIQATSHKKLAPVIDLMQALQKSLAGAERKPAAKAATHHKATTVRPRKTAKAS
jgi:DNA end-binding protein Ku